jgi:hypothetical protein
MITSLTDDPRVVYRKNLADNSVHTLVDCASKEVKTLESMAISCGTGTTFTLIYNDGSADYYIYNALVMSANTTVFINDFHPKIRYLDGTGTSQKLKVQAGAADRISVVAVMIDHLPVKENKNIGISGTGGVNVGWMGSK